MFKLISSLFLVSVCLMHTSTLAFNATEYEEFILEMSEDPLFIAEFAKFMKEQLEIDPNYLNYSPFQNNTQYKFECEKDADPTVPTSVNRLRPQDIKVVGALGDSLTAALGANAWTVLGLMVEYRSRSWSIGGKSQLESVVTLPNILKKFNPKLFGFNTASTFFPTSKDGKGFNSAVSGQEANHMPEQAQRLVDRLKQSKVINYQKDWKMITLFIGGNDLCDYCKDTALHSPKQYIEDIRGALDIFYQNLPNTFVNLVTVLRADQVKQLNLNFVCNTLHRMTCPCAAFPQSAAAEKELQEAQNQYQSGVEELVNSGKYEREDFTVVVQPFFKDFSVPQLPSGKVDTSYFAPDCFHLSSKGHAAAAIGLWNNLLQPVGKKQTTSSPDEKMICPSKAFPYFYTNKNSQA